MIDPALALSFNLHSQKGTYALLLGSGVSQAAGIPTGWDVTLDLVRKLAHADGAAIVEGGEANWYKAKTGNEPNYSTLLESVAPTPAAQQQVLRAYFEPTEAERENGIKLPTEAHHAIARLVAGGHIRVIVTTNFDRLTEAALDGAGVGYKVVASPDEIKGMEPLAHARCTVIKLHGDYLDQRIKNSPDALEKYDEETDKLLDQIWDEYGVIIAGWSGDYDTALRASIQRCKSRRYPTYWLARSSGPKTTAQALIKHRSAQIVVADGADKFFTELAEKVAALEEFNRPHPLSIAAAVTNLKRYMSDDRFRVQFNELLMDEAGAARTAILTGFAKVNINGGSSDSAPYIQLVSIAEAGCERLTALLAVAAYNAKPEHFSPLLNAFAAIQNTTKRGNGYTDLINLFKYPPLMAAYAIGVGAMLAGNHVLLRELSKQRASLKDQDDNGLTAPDRLVPRDVARSDQWNAYVTPASQHEAPLSWRLEHLLRAHLGRYCPDEDQFALVFDEFEFLWSLLHVSAQLDRQSQYKPSPPIGSFYWRKRIFEKGAIVEQAAYAAEGKIEWQPLMAGLFGGSKATLKAATDVAIPMMREAAGRLLYRRI